MRDVFRGRMKKTIDGYFVINGWSVAEQESFLDGYRVEFPGQILVGPDNFECSYSHDVIEDITFHRDLKPVVERLNQLHEENKKLKKEMEKEMEWVNNWREK